MLIKQPNIGTEQELFEFCDKYKFLFSITCKFDRHGNMRFTAVIKADRSYRYYKQVYDSSCKRYKYVDYTNPVPYPYLDNANPASMHIMVIGHSFTEALNRIIQKLNTTGIRWTADIDPSE